MRKGVQYFTVMFRVILVPSFSCQKENWSAVKIRVRLKSKELHPGDSLQN